MRNSKKALKFALTLIPIAVVAGIFIAIYQMETMPVEIMTDAIAEIGGKGILILITALQTVLYALFCGFFGYILAAKTGLWKPAKIEKKPLVTTFIISLVGGILFSLDYWVFGSLLEPVKLYYAAPITAHAFIASVIYGGVIEEIMLRLFFMSLISMLLWKIFCRKKSKAEIPYWVFPVANIIAALVFAAGHLPATIALFGELTPLILLRCFLLNGSFGLIFGRLYRKYGIIYAMIAHAMFHVVSKVIWLIFI